MTVCILITQCTCYNGWWCRKTIFHIRQGLDQACSNIGGTIGHWKWKYVLKAGKGVVNIYNKHASSIFILIRIIFVVLTIAIDVLVAIAAFPFFWINASTAAERWTAIVFIVKGFRIVIFFFVVAAGKDQDIFEIFRPDLKPGYFRLGPALHDFRVWIVPCNGPVGRIVVWNIKTPIFETPTSFSKDQILWLFISPIKGYMAINRVKEIICWYILKFSQQIFRDKGKNFLSVRVIKNMQHAVISAYCNIPFLKYGQIIWIIVVNYHRPWVNNSSKYPFPYPCRISRSGISVTYIAINEINNFVSRSIICRGISTVDAQVGRGDIIPGKIR